MNICIIPARGGSKRIPRKNIKLFCGKPMIEWAIAAAQSADIFERIFVSTDDAEIKETVLSLGVEVPFKRPEHLSDDFATTIDVMAHAVSTLGLDNESTVCCLYATAPFLQPEKLAIGPEKLNHADFAISVTSYAFPIQRALRAKSLDQIEMINPEQFTTRSQDLEECFHDAGQFYWAKASSWAARKSIFDGKVAGIPLPRSRVQDIDTPEDWELAEVMFRTLGLG